MVGGKTRHGQVEVSNRGSAAAERVLTSTIICIAATHRPLFPNFPHLDSFTEVLPPEEFISDTGPDPFDLNAVASTSRTGASVVP